MAREAEFRRVGMTVESTDLGYVEWEIPDVHLSMAMRWQDVIDLTVCMQSAALRAAQNVGADEAEITDAFIYARIHARECFADER